MPIKSEREYRYITAPFESRKAEEGAEEKSYIVEGYATTFNEPYEMYRDEDGNIYYEQVDRKAFDNTDMSDVILQYDHEGMVFARNKNGTLQLDVDDKGLKVTADLSSTEASRALYDAIDKGLVDQMSFAFVVSTDDYDRKTRTRTITGIRKLYDCSAVSIPANPDTYISARSYFEGVIKEEREEFEKAEKREQQKQRIRILTEVF